MPLYILHHIAQTFPFVVPGTFVVHIANARSIELARGQYVGNQSNVKRGCFANHCATALAL